MATRVCTEHAHAFERIHARVDDMNTDLHTVNVTLFGDPTKGVEGFLQKDARVKEQISMYLKIITFVSSAFTIAFISVLVKMFWGVK